MKCVLFIFNDNLLTASQVLSFVIYYLLCIKEHLYLDVNAIY